MFDIGAQELVLVAIIALIVVGPERMPRLARATGLWFGRARRALMTVKAEIDYELKAEELRDIIRKQNLNRPLETLLEQPPPSSKPPAVSMSPEVITPPVANHVNVRKEQSPPVA